MPNTNSLRSQLLRDKQKYQITATSRHAHFGGTLVLDKQQHDADGNDNTQQRKRKFLSTNQMHQILGGTNNTSNDNGQTHKRLKKNRKYEPFLGSGRSLAAHTRSGYEATTTTTASTDKSAVRAQQTLSKFCGRFLTQCYGPVMKSLKNEFRRDSSRLEDGDKVIFFRLIWFFFQWYRQQQSEEEEHRSKFLFTMDVFTFNLVLTSMDSFLEQKQHLRLAQTVALYNEMMQFLLQMYILSQKEDQKKAQETKQTTTTAIVVGVNNDNNPTTENEEQEEPSVEKLMAIGLMDRIFYSNEAMDKLPKLLSAWQPGMSTREYCCDVAELCHVTLKLLELNETAANKAMANNQEPTKKKRGGKQQAAHPHDPISKMMASAVDFDVRSYFVKKIVSNNVVFMYTKLLEQYLINAPHVNHRIVSFFLRLTKVRIASSACGGDEDDPSAAEQDKTKPQKLQLIRGANVTLEPMLYNIGLLMVYQRILNDKSIRNDSQYNATVSFAAKMVRNFYVQSQKNPVLFVECLLRHVQPHHFCQTSTNLYVNEELRMIAEKELLLEEYRTHNMEDDNDGMEEDHHQDLLQDEEMNPHQDNGDTNEDSTLEQRQQKRERLQILQQKQRQLQKMNDDDDDDDEDEIEFVGDDIVAAKTSKKKKKKKRQQRKRQVLLQEEDSDKEEEEKEDKGDDEKEEKTDDVEDKENDADAIKEPSASNQSKNMKKMKKLRKMQDGNDNNSDNDGIASDDDEVDFGGNSKNSSGIVTPQEQHEPMLVKKRFVIEDDDDE